MLYAAPKGKICDELVKRVIYTNRPFSSCFFQCWSLASGSWCNTKTFEVGFSQAQEPTYYQVIMYMSYITRCLDFPALKELLKA